MPETSSNVTEAFGYHSTTDDVLKGVDLKGKRILVTGASAGLGVETCRALCAHGASVVGAARDLNKALKATAEVMQAAHTANGSFELVQLDLADLSSVRETAKELVQQQRPFDVIICNAGVMAPPLTKTKDNFELQFGTNHLGHFVFVNKLVPLLREGSRVISLSSAGHRFANVDLDDPNFDKTTYEPFVAYGRSKTANSLFAVEFDKRHKERGIRAAAVHPGGIVTELGRHMTEEMKATMVARFEKLAEEKGYTWKTVPQGAATSVWAACVAPADKIGGQYCENCNVSHVLGENEEPTIIEGGVRPYAVDSANAAALWKKSEEMVGEIFA